MADRVLPFGTWPSPLGPRAAALGAARFGGIALGRRPDGAVGVWFSELCDGNNIVCCRDGRGLREVTKVRSARSRLNEYGGGAFWVGGETLYWVEDDDQRIRSLDPETGLVSMLTPEPPTPGAWRFAGGVVVPSESFTGGQWIVCESQRLCDLDGATLGEPVNELVAVRDPSGGAEPGIPVPIVGGADFVAAPAVSPDGRLLAWLAWDHPDMPWEAAALWAGRLVMDGTPRVLEARRVAGGRTDSDAQRLDRAVSVCLPAWSPTGVLHFCDDRQDRWLLRRAEEAGLPREGGGEALTAVWDGGGEVGEPRWVAGGSRYGFLDGDRTVLAETLDGMDALRVVDSGGREEAGAFPTSWIQEVACLGDVVAAVVGRPDRLSTVVRASARPGSAWRIEELRPAQVELPPGSISVPVPFDFPTAGDQVAYGLYFPPRLEGVTAPVGELPPLVVRIHGGPTAHARAEYSTSVQFWTTRGFAVVEVNYRGSSGYGREFRDLLNGGWGVAEVQDCLAAARHLAAEGLADPRRCVIRGGSAGGFTALEAVCMPPGEDGFAFAAATSLYGVTDLMALATDTHKFEARYLDGLVGPLPSAEQRYRERSPLHHAERIAAPVLILQGLEDRVVPPAQAEVLVAAMGANGVVHEYRAYEGEGHGFRSTDTVADALSVELAFYGRVLGFTPAAPVES